MRACGYIISENKEKTGLKRDVNRIPKLVYPKRHTIDTLKQGFQDWDLTQERFHLCKIEILKSDWDLNILL